MTPLQVSIGRAVTETISFIDDILGETVVICSVLHACIGFDVVLPLCCSINHCVTHRMPALVGGVDTSVVTPMSITPDFIAAPSVDNIFGIVIPIIHLMRQDSPGRWHAALRR